MADEDFSQQINFIAVDNARAAARVGDIILQAAERLGDYPSMGRVGRIAGTRELPIARTRYLLMYRIEHDEVVILRLMHGAMRWPAA